MDQYACLGVRFSKERSWDVHTRNLAKKWKTREGNLYSILPDRGLDRRIQKDNKYPELKSVIVLSCHACHHPAESFVRSQTSSKGSRNTIVQTRARVDIFWVLDAQEKCGSKGIAGHMQYIALETGRYST